MIPFVFRHWLEQAARAAIVAGGLLGATAADLFMPLFSGHLVDALTQGASDPAARRSAMVAFGGIVALGAVSMVLRLIGLQAIVPFTLKIMSDVSRDAFMRVQRFSTDWHANSFAGSTVRKITRGMWALDLLNDTILMALAPVADGVAGLDDPARAALALARRGHRGWHSDLCLDDDCVHDELHRAAARVSNAWDTKVGGTLADALTCNAVVNRSARKHGRTHGWPASSAAGDHAYGGPGYATTHLDGATRGAAVLSRVGDRRRDPAVDRGSRHAGDVTYVLTSYYIIHAYCAMSACTSQSAAFGQRHGGACRDPRRADRIADASDARPIDIQGGRIVFDGVTFHYGGHRDPLYNGLSMDIRAGERVGLVGRSGSGKTTFVKLVQRLYDIGGGRILIDGQDIADATQQFAA